MENQSEIDKIQENSHILLADNRNNRMVVKISKNKKFKWRKINIQLDKLIGNSFDNYFEVQQNGQLKLQENFQLPQEPADNIEEVEENKELKDNRNVVDDGQAQQLTEQQINELKTQGLSGSEIAQQIAKHSKTFQQKTDYCQEKYLKKKKQKYEFVIKPMKITIANLAETYFSDKPAKIAYLRPDSLSFLLYQASLFSGCNILVLDHSRGLGLGALAIRLNNEGKITLCNDQKFKFPSNFNCYKELDISQQITEKIKNSTIEEILKSNEKFSNFIIIGDFDPELQLRYFNSQLLPSCTIVIFSQFLEFLVKCVDFMKSTGSYVLIKTYDIFLREIQVLENRTHPLVNMDSFSGYILTAKKIAKL